MKGNGAVLRIGLAMAIVLTFITLAIPISTGRQDLRGLVPGGHMVGMWLALIGYEATAVAMAVLAFRKGRPRALWTAVMATGCMAVLMSTALIGTMEFSVANELVHWSAASMLGPLWVMAVVMSRRG